MTKKQPAKRTSRALMLGYLEKVSSKIFSDYSKELTELVGKKHGVYALYKGSRLYYVGLATNLRNRIKTHLNDKHEGKWDKFSLYLVRKADHIKELETLLLRITDPTGNTKTGRLQKAENLKKQLENIIKTAQQDQLSNLLGHKNVKQDARKKTKSKGSKIALEEYVNNRMKLRADYKGYTYNATLRKNGEIFYNGALYSSPSMAGRAVIKTRTPNGWNFWRYKDKKGEWVRLDKLRK